MAKAKPKKVRPFEICDSEVAPGATEIVHIPLGMLATHAPMTLPVFVVHGKRPGPVLFVSAAIHGDEILGVEVIHRLINLKHIRRIRGTLLLVPVVNVFGFIAHDRYLPDRRDLNRSFPGAPKGSLAARIAHTFMKEIVERADFGIDIHSALVNRTNLPQIRADFSNKKTLELGRLFGTPILMHSDVRDGSLREAGHDVGVDVLVYEAGEGLRFQEVSVRAGVRGVLRVMQGLGMLRKGVVRPSRVRPAFSQSSSWVRAAGAGIVRPLKDLGESVEEGDVLAVISDPIGGSPVEVVSTVSGVMVGKNNLPVVNQGDALFHIARVEDLEKAARHVERLESELSRDPLFRESNHTLKPPAGK